VKIKDVYFPNGGVLSITNDGRRNIRHGDGARRTISRSHQRLRSGESAADHAAAPPATRCTM
jgi:hypothetical protein